MDVDNIKDNIIDKFALPHISFPQESIEQKKLLALHVLNSSANEILLSPSYAFSYPAVISGLIETHIEYIAKHAPVNYKKELLGAIIQNYKIKEIFEIVQSMDDDMSPGKTGNQTRMRNVIQYVFDNKKVFEF
jgi:hypothetical protein